MTPAYAYGVVILPPADLYRKVLSLRKRHLLLSALAPPHVTVKSPFYFRQTGAMVIDQLEEICSRFTPFEMEIRGLGTFRQRVIYAKPQRMWGQPGNFLLTFGPFGGSGWTRCTCCAAGAAGISSVPSRLDRANLPMPGRFALFC